MIEYPSKSSSIGITVFMWVPPISHDNDLLLKSLYHFILFRLDDVMWSGTELDLMGYALIASEAR